MKEEDRIRARILASKGQLFEALEYFSRAASHQKDKDQAVLFLAEMQSLKRKAIAGIISTSDEQIAINQITKRFLQHINLDQETAVEENRSKRKKQVVFPVLLAVFVITAGVIFQDSIFFSKHQQLTVYVTDIHGNVVLEQEGELHIPVGNRPLNAQIGEDGRTNFGDILAEHLGKTITIGLKAEGWEIVGNNNKFIFTGEPIHLIIQPDNSLGTIKGNVRSRDGQKFLADAAVRINTDTIIYSDKNGLFNIILPHKMRIKDNDRSYLLTISKEGYKTKDQYYNPKSSEAEIRLEELK